MVTRASQLFSRAEEIKEDEEQLLKLFWNRAELKKELDNLRNDTYRLTDQLKQEQAIKLRIQQRLEQLEALLGNPATASAAATYYQLRRVWNLCHDRLAAVSGELEKAHHDKEYRLHIADFRRKLYQSLTGVQLELNEVNRSGDLLSNQIRVLREQRGQKQGFWNFFRRRQLTSEINSRRMERRSITMRLGELTEEIQSRSSIEPPEFAGLNVAAKRTINLTVIAYAQEFYLCFADQDIARKAREASFRQVSDVRYGDARDSRALGRDIEERIALLEADASIRSRMQQRVQQLQSVIKYRSDADTIPIAETLESIAILKPDGKPRSYTGVNVLADEYWDVFSVLLT